jgi:hypothetical protein
MSTPRHGEILPPGASRHTTTWSLLVGLPGWGLIGFVFWQAAKEPLELFFLIIIWIASLVLLGIAIFLWSRYAKRRKVQVRKVIASGRSDSTLPEKLLLKKDALGRNIRVQPKAQQARIVRVQIEGETKTFRRSD